MEVFTCKIDNQGRLSLPATLRKRAGIDPDTEVLVFFEDGGLVVATRQAAVAQAQRLVREVLGDYEGSLVEDLIAERRREAAKEAELGRSKKSA